MVYHLELGLYYLCVLYNAMVPHLNYLLLVRFALRDYFLMVRASMLL